MKLNTSNCFACKYFGTDQSRRIQGEDVYLCSKGKWKTVYRIRTDEAWTEGEKPKGQCPDYMGMTK
jgi:hypothetical protein